MTKQKGRAYAPWREDFAAAVAFGALAFVAVLITAKAGSFHGYVAGGGVTVALAMAAKWAWRNGSRRKHGKFIERIAVAELGRLLDRKGIPWHAGAMVRGLGDVDFVAAPTTGLVVIEIKSFVRWRQGWFSCGEREAAAIAQATRQRDALNARSAFVWLPMGRPRLMQRVFGAGNNGVRVIFGGAKNAYSCCSN